MSKHLSSRQIIDSQTREGRSEVFKECKSGARLVAIVLLLIFGVQLARATPEYRALPEYKLARPQYGQFRYT